MERVLVKLLITIAVLVIIAMIAFFYFTPFTSSPATTPYGDIADAISRKLVYMEANSTLIIPNVVFHNTLIAVKKDTPLTIVLRAKKTTVPGSDELLRILTTTYNLSYLIISDSKHPYTVTANISNIIYYYEIQKNATYLRSIVRDTYAYLQPLIFVNTDTQYDNETGFMHIYIFIHVFSFDKIIYMATETSNVQVTGTYNIKIYQYTEKTTQGFYERTWIEEPDDIWLFISNATSTNGIPLTHVEPGDHLYISIEKTHIVVELVPAG